MDDKKGWYVLYTKPRQEKIAKQQLDELYIKNYLPTTLVKKKWSDRIKKVEEVLIRSYIFIQCNEKERLTALELPSIVRTLFENGKPAIVPDWQINNLRLFLQKVENAFLEEKNLYGTKVLIKEGPFAGIVGVINKTLNGCLISVTLDFMKRSINAIVPEEHCSIIEIFNEQENQLNNENIFHKKFSA